MRADFNPSSSTLSINDNYDWFYGRDCYPICYDTCLKGTGAIIDPSDKYLFLTISDSVIMDNWLIDISDSETTPVLVGHDTEYSATLLWGMAITKNASRIFLSTGPTDSYYEHIDGNLLTYSFSTTEGLRLIELRGPLSDSSELGYILKSPDDSHLYIELPYKCWSLGPYGGIFSINPYISPMQISWETPPVSNSIFDSSGKHLYSNSRMVNWNYDGKMWHYIRNDDPTTNTFGLLTLTNKYDAGPYYQLPDNKNILSKDENLVYSFYSYQSFGGSTRTTAIYLYVYIRNKQDGSLKWICGKKFDNIGYAYKFICPPDKNKIYILIDDEIYLFETSEDPWVFALRQVLLGNEVKSDFYDYNNDGEVSIADLIKRLNEIKE